MMGTDYVIREAVAVTPGQVTVTVVDMRGHVVNVTVPRTFTTPARLDPIIRFALGARHRERRPLR